MKMAAIMRVTASRSNTRVGRQRLSPHRQKPVGTRGRANYARLTRNMVGPPELSWCGGPSTLRVNMAGPQTIIMPDPVGLQLGS